MTGRSNTFYNCIALKGAKGYAFSASYVNSDYANLDYYMSAKFISNTAVWSIDGSGNLVVSPQKATTAS